MNNQCKMSENGENFTENIVNLRVQHAPLRLSAPNDISDLPVQRSSEKTEFQKTFFNFSTSSNCSPLNVSNTNFSNNNSFENSSSPSECILIDIPNSALLQQPYYEPVTCSTKSLQNDRLQNYVYQVLNESGEGQFLIQLYDFESIAENKELLLKKKNRIYFSINKVARLLIFHEIRRTGSYAINYERLEFFAENAAKLFPKYLKESFYTKSNNNHNAHGVLQTFYSKLREVALAVNIMPKSRCYKRKLDDEETFSDEFKDLQQPINVIDESYKKKWSTTATNEKIAFFKKNDIKTAFLTFPNLQHSLGYTLIQADFNTFFNKSSDIFCRNWPNVAHKIIKLAKTKKNDKEIKGILRSVPNDKYVEILALMVLPYLFPKITKLTNRSKTGKSWNPEKAVVLKTFIYHIKETGNINDLLQNAYSELQELHVEKKLILQPYVVINGQNLDTITSAYVILGTHTYQVPTTILAVDLCFQCIKVLHESFPHVCNHVWQFLEHQVYKFDVPHLCGAVANLINKLNDCL